MPNIGSAVRIRLAAKVLQREEKQKAMHHLDPLFQACFTGDISLLKRAVKSKRI